MRRATGFGCIVAVALMVGAAHTAWGQAYEWRPGEGLPGTSGQIFAMTAWDPDGDGPQPERLVMGGGYTVAGNVVASRIATWDGATWQALGSGMNNSVSALAVYNGQLIAAGSFTTAGGATCNYIARWTGTAWQSLGTGLSASVSALTVYNGQLIAGGTFTSAGSVACSRIAAWDGTAWQPLGSGANNAVSALAVYNGQLVAGGIFTTAGGVACNNIARWNGTAWQTLDGGVTGGGVSALLVYDNQLIAGGTFTTAGGVASKYIARWDGATWQSIGGGVTAGSAVYCLGIYNGQLIAGGNFTTVGGVSCSRLARWDGAAWQGLGSGATNSVSALMVYNGQLIAGGIFTTAGGIACNYVAGWNGSTWQALAAGMNGAVTALAAQGVQLYAGGSFTAAGGVPCNYIAHRDAASTWLPMGSGMNGAVAALAFYNDQLIATGSFTTAGSTTCNRIARWDGAAWQPLGSGLNGSASCLVVHNGQLIVGGTFTSAGGVACNRIASWNGSAWQPLDGGVNSSVNALAVYSNQLIAGGYFTTAGSVTCNRIARWDGTAWQVLGSGMNASVAALTVNNGQLIAGGEFTNAGGVACASVASWNGSAWQPLAGGANGPVSALAVYNNQLYATGSFGAAGGIACRTIASWNGSTWQSLSGGLDGSLSSAMTVCNGELIVGGGFIATYDGKAASYWARWGPVMPTFLEQPVSQTVVQGDPVTFSVKAIGAGTLSYQWRKDGQPLSDSAIVQGATTATLTIGEVAVADGGVYDCVATNLAGSTTSNPAVLTVKVPAAIVTQPADAEAQAGQTATFSVEASGSDVLTYQWRKAGVALGDNGRISGSTTSTLSLSAVAMADAGTYDVVVTNAYGSATSQAVTLSVLPTILTQPVSQEVILGSPIHLSIAAVGSGELAYQWRKDGAALNDGGNVAGATTASLTVTPSLTGDAGSYDVVVTSEFGTATSEAATIAIMLPPTIASEPASQSVLVGEPVTLSVTAGGSGSLTYQWRKDGAALADDGRVLGSTTHVLTIHPTQVTDAASYDVVVTSEFGTVTSDAATVTINVPPTIVTQPAGQSVLIGEPLTLSVEATGSGILAYQWRKDGVDVAGANAATLAVQAAAATDAGTYTVVVSSAYGTVTSDAATVTIHLPPTIVTQPTAQVLLLGEPLTLSVEASGSGTLLYQWRKDGVDVAGANAATLAIQAAAATDAGTYTVVVSSAYGTVTSDAATVTINLPPTIVTQPLSQAVTLGDAVTLSVEAAGSGTLAYQWRKDGADLAGATAATLTINPAQASDVGSYDVVVTSEYGTVTSEIAVIAVNLPPVIATQPASQSVTLGEPVTLSVVAVGSGTLTYQWRKDGVAMADATAATLTLNPTQASDVGSYDVVITSEYGTVTSDAATIAVNLPPTILTQPVSLSVTAGESMTLSVTASGSGSLTYQWRKGGVAIATATSSTLTFRAVSPADTGSYDVVVGSEYGTVTSSVATLTVQASLAIVTQPVSQGVLVGQPVTLSVVATGAGTLTYQWRKNGVAVVDGGTVSGSATATLSISAAASSNVGSYDVVVTSPYGAVTSNAATIAVSAPPTITTQPASQTGTSGDTITLSVQAAGSGSLTYQWRKNGVALSNGGRISGSTTATLTISSAQTADAGSYDVVVTSQYGSITSAATTVTVTNHNTAPTVTITAPTSGQVQAANSNITFTATISDPDLADTHTATWTLHDDYWGTRVIPGVVNGHNIQNVIQVSGAGVYDVTLTVTDSAGATGTATSVGGDPAMQAFVVIYDPSAGYVTGGGWLTSPPGSLKWTPSDTNNGQGLALFGFVARYKKGLSVPTGATAFYYIAGGFSFVSTDYDWLIVAGHRAQYRGHGTIVGKSGTYAFTLTAVDDPSGDRFRIKVWNESSGHVIYDNRRGQDDDADPTRIDGGSIIIQK